MVVSSYLNPTYNPLLIRVFNIHNNPALRSQVLRQGGLDRNVWFNQWCSAPIKIPAKNNKNKMEVKYE